MSLNCKETSLRACDRTCSVSDVYTARPLRHSAVDLMLYSVYPAGDIASK